jgi:hypothetical protein
VNPDFTVEAAGDLFAIRNAGVDEEFEANLRRAGLP